MKLFFFRGPNFGDDLNEYLLPKVFPNFFDEDASVLFLGIGSILFDFHPKEATKIVFGSGFGKYTPPPVIDASWKVYCVRGPRTADALGLDRSLVAADGAILINKFRNKDRIVRHKFSFMPHWNSLNTGHWEQISRDVGLNFIDPRLSVEHVLSEIESSEVIIAEAMHGAITADALRIPWISLSPVEPINRFKWHDWAEALDIKLQPLPLSPSSIKEKLVASLGDGRSRRRRQLISLLHADKLLDIRYKAAARESLKNAMLAQPSLSSDSSLLRALDRLETAAFNIRRDFS